MMYHRVVFGAAALVVLWDGATAEAGAPPTSAPDRPDTVQVWTCQPPRELTAFDVPEPGTAPAIRLVGVRNARFAGQVVLASAKPIKGLAVAVSDLTRDGGQDTIPARQVAVRYAVPAEALPLNWYVPEHRFDTLLDTPPRETAPRSIRVGRGGSSVPVGAVQPVWITVTVPADAAPGLYRGRVTVSAEGLPATPVPLSIKVHEWTMPDARDYIGRHNIWPSHESSALRYGVPFWSDRHFELMGQVLALTRPMGNSLCVIHVIVNAYHQNNSQSMIRWVRKGQNEYEHDFTIFDRYLDLFEAQVGKPNIVLVTAFGPYVDAKDKDGNVAGAAVSLLNRETGAIENLRVPDYGTPESVAFWKPVIGAVLDRLDKRGLKDALVIGTASDNGPKTPAPVTMFRDIWPECRLMFSGHPRPGSLRSDRGPVPVTCVEHVWTAGSLRKQYPVPGRPVPGTGVFAFSRAGAGMCHLQQNEELAAYRANPEMCLQSGNIGIGRVGADFWGLPGRRTVLSGDSGAHIGQSASVTAFTAAGPDGPVTTERLEMFIEGVQTREAISYLLMAVAAKTLDPALAARVGEYLTQRAAAHLPFQPKTYTLERGLPYLPDWQEKEDALFTLCAEVAKALASR